MNDFHATPVRWAEFCAAFQAANLSLQLEQAQGECDHESAMSLSQDFLSSWLWDHSTAIDESLPMTLGFYQLGALTRAYQTVRILLAEQTRRALDALFLPFIGQWLAPPASSVGDLSPEMKLLVHGGLSFSLAPERCASIITDLDSLKWRDEVIGALSRTNVDIGDQEVSLSMTSELIALVSLAVRHHCGVIAVFEI